MDRLGDTVVAGAWWEETCDDARRRLNASSFIFVDWRGAKAGIVVAVFVGRSPPRVSLVSFRTRGGGLLIERTGSTG